MIKIMGWCVNPNQKAIPSPRIHSWESLRISSFRHFININPVNPVIFLEVWFLMFYFMSEFVENDFYIFRIGSASCNQSIIMDIMDFSYPIFRINKVYEAQKPLRVIISKFFNFFTEERNDS